MHFKMRCVHESPWKQQHMRASLVPPAELGIRDEQRETQSWSVNGLSKIPNSVSKYWMELFNEGPAFKAEQLVPRITCISL